MARTADHTTTTVYVALDPATGVHRRPATDDEIRAYRAGQLDTRGPAFDQPVKVGNILVDKFTGPAVWYGGAGF